MTLHPDSCVAGIRLNDDVVAWLDQRPRAQHEVQLQPFCALESGHPGPHAVMGQQGDGVEWWVRWTLDAFEVVEQHVCPAEGDMINKFGEPDICLLFDGHPGRHSFEF